MTEGFDVGLEMSGNAQAFQSMLTNMNHGGRVALLGILADQVGIDWSQVIFKGLVIKGSTAAKCMKHGTRCALCYRAV